MSDRRRDAEALQKRLSADLVGQQLQGVERREHDWVFSFVPGVQLRLECPWRIVAKEQLCFADGDDGQLFGLPAPVDGVRTSEELLLRRVIDAISIRGDTADITIEFHGGVLLEVWSNSSGYETWEISGQDFNVVALGGGGFAIWGIDVGSDKQPV